MKKCNSCLRHFNVVITYNTYEGFPEAAVR